MAVFDSWGKKYVRVHVDMANGTRYTFTDFAMNVKVDKKGSPDLPEGEVTIKGLSLETMEQLTSLTFLKNARQNNILVIEAGYTEDTIAQIYRGEITSAKADFNSAPDIEFVISSKSGSYPSVIPQSPISVKGQQPAIEVIKQLAADLIIDDNTIVVTPRGQPRKNGITPELSKDNGLIGYPTFTDEGLQVVCFFNPELQIGGTIRIDTIVPKAKGTWKITEFSHELEVNSSSSATWRSSFNAVYVGD